MKSKPIITNGEPIRLAGVVNFTNKLGSKIWDAEIKSVERVTLAKYAEGSFLKVKAVSVKESYQTAYPAEKIEIWIPLSWLLHDSKDYPTRIEKLVASYYADEIISGGGNFREAVEANGFKNCKSVGTVND
ncbi:MAG: hypothetical protein NTV34_03015 [Proteobacteria bacterium]|nr:hypothetical protein [Pseudomonadota bacterium]